MAHAQTPITTIDQYIDTFPKDVQSKLQTIRTLIKEEAPEAKEAISYKIAAFNLNNRYLIYFAGWKDHISIYPFSSDMEEFIEGSSAYKISGKGTIQFPINRPLPIPLIRKIIQHRININIANSKKK